MILRWINLGMAQNFKQRGPQLVVILKSRKSQKLIHTFQVPCHRKPQHAQAFSLSLLSRLLDFSLLSWGQVAEFLGDRENGQNSMGNLYVGLQNLKAEKIDSCSQNVGWCRLLSPFGKKIIPIVYMVVSWNRATPSHHPFLDGIFHEINHPAIGVPPFMQTTSNHHMFCWIRLPCWSKAIAPLHLSLLLAVVAIPASLLQPQVTGCFNQWLDGSTSFNHGDTENHHMFRKQSMDHWCVPSIFDGCSSSKGVHPIQEVNGKKWGDMP